MTATAHAPSPRDRAERPPAVVWRPPEPGGPQRLGLFHDEPAALVEAAVQRKAVVGSPDDPLEREADRAADRVVQGAPVQPLSRLGSGPVRRCAACGQAGCACGASEEESLVQRQPLDDDEDLVQARSESGRPAERGPAMHEAARRAVQSPGAGEPLRPDARRSLESGFGVDLGDVRIHDDAAAHRSAAALRAHAFAHDRHIWLGRGASQGDLHLMAHETAHVLQQDGVVRRRLAKAPDESEPVVPPAEDDAVEAVAEAVTRIEDSAALPPEDSPGSGGEPGDGLLMPEPPEALSATERATLGAVDARAGEAATEQTDLPNAEAQTGEARAAVTEPQEEANARAEQALVDALGERPAPSAEVEELCARIRGVIESKTPPDEETLARTNPEAVAADAGRQLDGQLEGEVAGVEGSYDRLEQPQPGAPGQTGSPLQPPPESVETPDPRATEAVPDGVAPQSVSLDADVEAAQARRDQSGMTGDVAGTITDPSNPVVQAREAQGELEATAAQGPDEAIAEQRGLLAAAEADMAALQARALAALHRDRAGTVRDATGQQGAMVGAEQQTRESVAREANQIYTDAQTNVRDQLRPLQEAAMNRWERGVGVLSAEFRRNLDRVAAWIRERHDGTWGSVVGVWDDLTGLPDWVTREYDQAERAFGDGVCSLLREISTEVNTVILVCERIIADAGAEIDALFDALPEDLREWAETERAGFHERLDGLAAEVQQTRQSLTNDLTERAAQSVDEVRREVHELRETAKGLVGRLADAVGAFLDDPARFILEGLLQLVGIEPASFWAVVARIQSVVQDIADDPLGFAGNLLLAVGQGFERFFDHIGEHLLSGLLDWLFSGLGSVGVEIPQDTSLKSVVTFFLQLMGITWDRIRTILARHIGEENVELLERAYEIVASLIEMGPEGVFEMIKEQLDPQRLLSMVLEAAIDFLVEALISQVTARVLLLFNPVGAIVQAVEAIYRVLKWLFENAARLFSLVETVVNGVADLLAGNVSGMAEAIEGSLARLVSPVIDFFAGYVGLGDLPEKIADVIRRMQTWVEGILDRVIGFIAGQARRLLAALGIGGEDEEPITEEDTGDNFIYEHPEGSHTVKIDRNLRVFRFSDPVALLGATAQEEKQEALESLVSREAPQYPTDGLNRAQGPHGHAPTVKDGDARESLPALHTLPGGRPAYQPGDQRGHLIGDRFGGSAGSGNLVPMHSSLNLSTFKTYENTLASAYKQLDDAGEAVLLHMTLTPVYPADVATDPASYRPTRIVAHSTIVTLKPDSSPLQKKVTSYPGSFNNPLPNPSRVDLNDSEREDLLAAGLSSRLVSEILSERDRRGRFGGLDDFMLRMAYRLGADQAMVNDMTLLGEAGARAGILTIGGDSLYDLAHHVPTL